MSQVVTETQHFLRGLSDPFLHCIIPGGSISIHLGNQAKNLEIILDPPSPLLHQTFTMPCRFYLLNKVHIYFSSLPAL